MTGTPEEPGEPLRGRRIAVAETRELELFAGLLARRGAEVFRYPLVRIVDAPDPAPVLAWLRRVAAGECDDLVFYTGEGLRRLLGCCDRHEPALRAAFLAGLARARTLVRGPKPARELRELGITPSLQAPTPTTDGVIAALGMLELDGRRVGLQLYGEQNNPALQDFLQAAGATVLPVWPYRYLEGCSAEAVADLLARLRSGEVEAIAFTSLQQVERLFAAAPATDVCSALNASLVAAVGPLVAAALQARGVLHVASPADSWFLKPLTRELVRLLAAPAPP